MKLVYAIVRNVDSSNVLQELNKRGFYVTKLSSTGGFLREGNTTFMIGTDDDKVDEAIGIVKREVGPRQEILANPANPPNFDLAPVMVSIGGATIFVTDVDRFERI